MTIRRRKWYYRLPGDMFARFVNFTVPMPLQAAKSHIARMHSIPAASPEIYSREPR